ncbi:MAG TPA: TMEM175 family protein [bacterium]|nr:TMEM175 family protein [bacterium]
MTKTRLEAFSDGVLAIILTIMVLELQLPKSASLDSLAPLLPLLAAYLLSFVFIGIYWTNHHHMFQVVKKVNGAVLWANLHLLFWLSLVPFATGWIAEQGCQRLPVVFYGGVLLGAAIAYFILVRTLFALEGPKSALAVALGSDFKGKISVVIYLAAIVMAWVQPWVSYGCYVAVALMWLVPDRRIERHLGKGGSRGD